MAKQFIITISREFGSGGHEIGRKLAEKLGIDFYDRKLLDQIAADMNMSVATLEKYEEKKKNVLFSRTVRGYSNSPEEIVAQLQFDFIRNLAKKGDSFVIVGRCAESVLRSRGDLISIFVTADNLAKVERVQKHFGLSAKDADKKRNRHDNNRKKYHNEHSEFKWGDSRGYDITINSSRLGVDGTVDALYRYCQDRIAAME